VAAPSSASCGNGISGIPLGTPFFLLPFGVAVLILAGLLGVTPGALFWLCLPLPIVRYLAAEG
jgi:hypothetical protein